MRDAKKKERNERITGGMSSQILGGDRGNINNEYIERILAGEDPFVREEEKGANEEASQATVLKVATHLIDMQISAPVSNM